MKLENYPALSAKELDEAIGYAIEQVRSCLADYTTMFKYPNSVNNFYPQMMNTEWTNGFWTGEIWLAYEMTKDEEFKKSGLAHVDSYHHRIKNNIVCDHHDLGFLYSPSCVAAYKLLGDEKAKEAAVMAADKLITRFQEKGEFIQAWGPLGAKDNYRLIIDCLLNLPLLYWTTEVTGDPKYRDIALRHIKTALSVVIREDYSTFHTYFFDPETGAPSHGVSHQGNRAESAWARGQAWGIYGLAISYRYTKDPKYLELFRHVTNYFIDHLPSNLVPYWDFDFTDGSDEPRDSSASAAAACGMLEMAKHVDAEEAEVLKAQASRLIKALVDNCSVRDPKISNGQILNGTYCRSTTTNGCRQHGVDECTAWGDYYYFEALMRLKNENWNMYW